MRTLTSLVSAVLIAVCGVAVAQSGTVKQCQDCGTVRQVDPMTKGSGEASGKGAIIGAVIGGVVGHQFGSGKGNDAATAAGAVAGGVAGHQVEKQGKKPTSYYRITIDMDSGTTREVNVADPRGVAVGARVRVTGNNIEMMSG